jgi:ribosomal protein S18 acetylase RimI-like enzyme
MPLSIRPSREEDQKNIVSLLVELQRHIAAMDPFRKNKTPDMFDADRYFETLKNDVTKGEGVIFVEDTDVVGLIAGIIIKADERNDGSHYPATEGRVLELVVADSQRRKGIGVLLMEKMEEYFRERDCMYVRVEVFAPNTQAADFYRKNGYSERTLDFMKKL